MRPSSVGVISTFQTPFRSSHPDVTYVEQAQQAAVGALQVAKMRPDDIDVVVFLLGPTFFMGVADADRWAIDHVFGAGKPFFRVHNRRIRPAALPCTLRTLWSRSSAMFGSVMVVGAERLVRRPTRRRFSTSRSMRSSSVTCPCRRTSRWA